MVETRGSTAKKEAPTVDAGKAAAATHDKVNFVWFLALVGLTIYPFVKSAPFADAETYRFASVRDAGWKADASDTAPGRHVWSVAAAGAAAAGGLSYHFVSPGGLVGGLAAGLGATVPLGYAAWAARGAAVETASSALGGSEDVPAYVYVTWAALLYSIFDLLYMFAVPACTLKAATLVPHHCATIMLTVSALEFGAEPLTALCMLVELNTLVLTLMNLKRAPGPGDAFTRLAKAADKVLPLKVLFLGTWITLRLGVYPYLLYYFHYYFGHERYGMRGYCQTVGALCVLNVLNFKWTAEFYAPKPKSEKSTK